MSGRTGMGLNVVEILDGDARDKRRLRMILATIAGEMTVDRACRELDLGRTRFYDLRAEVLQAAMDALKPRGPGRPRAPRESREVLDLQRQLVERDRELMMARVREGLLMAMPSVLSRSLEGASEKGGSRPNSAGPVNGSPAP